MLIANILLVVATGSSLPIQWLDGQRLVSQSEPEAVPLRPVKSIAEKSLVVALV